jgi:hypothetical protein
MIAHLLLDQEIYKEYRRGPQQLAERHVVGITAQEAASDDVDVARGPEVLHEADHISAKQVEERVIHRAGIGLADVLGVDPGAVRCGRQQRTHDG